MKTIEIKDVIDNLADTYISESQVHGNGLYSLQDIKKGFVLGELDGQIVDWDLHQKYNMAFEWNAITQHKLLVRPYRTKYSYINHSRTPNLVLQGSPLKVVALRDIEKDEELFLDYRKEPLPAQYLELKGRLYL